MVASEAIDGRGALVSDAAAIESQSARAKLEVAAARRYRSWGERALLGAVSLGAVGTFYGLTRAIRWERGRAADRAIVHAVGRARGPAGNIVARVVTALGAVPAVSMLIAVSLVRLRKRPRMLGQVAAGALGAVTAELVIKRFFRRERPTLLAHLEDVSSTAFPSGHAMAGASVYLTLAFVGSRTARLRRFRSALVTGAGALAAMIGSSRVYLGVHWPTDVLGGLTLGTAWACSVESLVDFSSAWTLEELAWRRRRRLRLGAAPMAGAPVTPVSAEGELR